MQTRPLSPLSKVLISMAARSCGVRSDEVSGVSTDQASNTLSRLASRGHLIKLVEGHKAVRYFVHQLTLEAYVRNATKVVHNTPSNTRSSVRATWGPNTPPTPRRTSRCSGAQATRRARRRSSSPSCTVATSAGECDHVRANPTGEQHARIQSSQT